MYLILYWFRKKKTDFDRSGNPTKFAGLHSLPKYHSGQMPYIDLRIFEGILLRRLDHIRIQIGRILEN